jgi:hypothetical protein
LRAVRGGFVGQQGGTPLVGKRPEERGFAAGSGTQIKPGFGLSRAARL